MQLRKSHLTAYTVLVKKCFHTVVLQMLQSRFCVGKKTLNDFFKLGNLFNVPEFKQSFDRTIFLLHYLCPLIHERLQILRRELFCSSHLKLQGVFFFQLLHQWCVCYTFDVHFDYLSLLLSPSSAYRSSFWHRGPFIRSLLILLLSLAF